MDFTRYLRLMPDDQRQQIQKVIDTLRMGGRSDAIHRFLKYFQDEDNIVFKQQKNQPDFIF